MEYDTSLPLFIQSLGQRSYLITAFLTVVVAIGVRYVMHREQQQSTSSEDSKSTQFIDTHDDVIDAKVTNVKTRQSRLLRQQFGILEEDLLLYEESFTENYDGTLTLIKVDGSIHSEPTPTDAAECNLRSIHENIAVNDDILVANAGTKVVTDNSEKSDTTREGGHSQNEQAQNLSAVISLPSSPVATTLQKKSRQKEQQKSQYERLQEYRRQQMLVAAEARLEQQRQFRSESSLPSLFHFWTWYDTQASLYRQYTLVRNDDIEDNATIVPYHSSSRRNDKISIQLRITNELDVPISVYWIDHIGKHMPRGVILARGGRWQQTTYVDHPWIFKTSTAALAITDDKSNDLCDKLSLNDNTETVLLHFIPHQVIPSTMDAPTLDDEINQATKVISGIHRFHIIPSVKQESAMYNCAVHDPILPFPASKHILSSRKAAEFALQHCIRMRYDKWVVLQKYIRNIIHHPNDLRYRYIRIANSKFSDAVWNTPAKGVLLAYNFIEQCDIGYVSFGGNIIANDIYREDEQPEQLSNDTLQELQLLLHMIQLSEQKAMTEYGYQ
jgi:PUB domain